MATSQASASADEAGRLRRALLDAEIEGQQATVAGEAARKQLQQVGGERKGSGTVRALAPGV